MELPIQILWVRVKWILRHVDGTADAELASDRSKSELFIQGFYDASLAGCRLCWESATGYIIIVTRAALPWKFENNQLWTRFLLKPSTLHLKRQLSSALGSTKGFNFQTEAVVRLRYQWKLTVELLSKWVRRMQAHSERNALTFVITWHGTWYKKKGSQEASFLIVKRRKICIQCRLQGFYSSDSQALCDSDVK